MLVVPAEEGSGARPAITRLSVGGGRATFSYRRQTFECAGEADLAAAAFAPLAFPEGETAEVYLASRGLHAAQADVARKRYGANALRFPEPSIGGCLAEQCTQPFFVFQILCVVLWCLDEYWYYALFTLVMLLLFEAAQASNRVRQMIDLRRLPPPRADVLALRDDCWEQTAATELLPGDIISVGGTGSAGATDGAGKRAARRGREKRGRPPTGEAEEHSAAVPADVLLLHGRAVVNEAMLTGESTPQWKVPADALGAAERVAPRTHRASVLFAGTTLVQCSPATESGAIAAPLRPPDGGCPAYVLRTGFDTAQGDLMRTILFSAENVTANTREAGLFIVFLLCFAVAASAYVLKHGLADPDRSRYKLLLSCIMIVTSVVPPELPMELSMAVNNSLIGLARHGVFCTEPFRIPMAGKIGVACFDKTGTLTSDSLRWRGVAAARLAQREGEASADEEAESGPAAAAIVRGEDIPREAEFVLGACHSLIHVAGSTAPVGDPIERVAMAGVGWVYAASGVASRSRQAAAPGRAACRLTLLRRHHFSSELQRMSVVARVEGGDEDVAAGRVLVLAKGSPEAIATLLRDMPAGYHRAYRALAREGARVLALAYRPLEANAASSAGVREAPRAEHESSLLFAGFAVFGCPMKAASAPTLREIGAGGHRLLMITGDAAAAAVYAAARCHIIPRGAERGAFVLREAAGADGEALRWYGSDAEGNEVLAEEWSAARVAALAASCDGALCAEGSAVRALTQRGELRALVAHARVFARATPQCKESVLSALRALGAVTLMCGDGTNDVGALRRAHVGVALLSVTGGGGCHFDDLEDEDNEENDGDADGVAEALEARSMAPGVDPRFGVDLPSVGDDDLASQLTGGAAGGAQPAERHRERLLAAAKRRRQKQRALAAELAASDGTAPVVQLGDASMASAFTARSMHVGPVAAVLRLGRATLVTTVQMFKILGVNCLTSAYSMSVMAIDGVKIGDTQATVIGLISAALFMFLSLAKPLPTLSSQWPHTSPFSAYALWSVGLQAAIHLCFLVCAVASAKRAAASAGLDALVNDPDADFAPSIINSVAYTASVLITLSTFAVNYVGEPFNEPLTKNKPLLLTLAVGFFVFVLAAADSFRPLGDALELAPLPAGLGFEVVLMALMDGSAAWLAERAARFWFPAAAPTLGA